MFVMYCSYGAGLFYGAHRVAGGHMEGGKVIAVLMATMMGSFALTQVSWRAVGCCLALMVQ